MPFERPLRSDEMERDQRAATPAPGPAATPPARVLALQRSAGNAAVSRLLQRDPVDLLDPPGPSAGIKSPQGPYGKAYNDERKARDDYVAAGKKGPLTYNPSESNKDNYYGGFDVEYDPKDGKGELKVQLKGACNFLPGITLNAKGRAVAKEPSAQTAAAVKTINALPKDERPAEVAKWKWSKDGGAESGDEDAFKIKYASVVSSGWQGKHEFHSDKQWWEDVGATVAVEERGDDLLRREVGFETGKSDVGPNSKKRLEGLAKNMPNAKAGAAIAASDLTATVPGADDAEKQARFAAVCAILEAGGMAKARIKFVDGGTGDWGSVVVGTGAKQTVAAHEAGHMFGLDDEYTGGGAYSPGRKTEHTDFAAKEGFTGAMHATSDAIMSGGKEVRQHHYVTFIDALRKVSGMKEWTFGPPQAVTPPSEMGDYPLPDPNATTGVG